MLSECKIQWFLVHGNRVLPTVTSSKTPPSIIPERLSTSSLYQHGPFAVYRFAYSQHFTLTNLQSIPLSIINSLIHYHSAEVHCTEPRVSSSLHVWTDNAPRHGHTTLCLPTYQRVGHLIYFPILHEYIEMFL